MKNMNGTGCGHRLSMRCIIPPHLLRKLSYSLIFIDEQTQSYSRIRQVTNQGGKYFHGYDVIFNPRVYICDALQIIEI